MVLIINLITHAEDGIIYLNYAAYTLELLFFKSELCYIYFFDHEIIMLQEQKKSRIYDIIAFEGIVYWSNWKKSSKTKSNGVSSVNICILHKYFVIICLGVCINCFRYDIIVLDSNDGNTQITNMSLNWLYFLRCVKKKRYNK